MTENDFWKKIGVAVAARPCKECPAYGECTCDMTCGEIVKAMYESVAGKNGQGDTDHRADNKNATDWAQERKEGMLEAVRALSENHISDGRKMVLPTPCTKVDEETVREWLQKINEELDELKDAILTPVDLEWKQDGDGFCTGDAEHIAEEAADTITAITSMLEAMGIDERMRQEAQERVNRKNRKRGRL